MTMSRQATGRPLLTPGEVMQLPPDEELVMVAGHPPLRARKLRYYADRNFTSRVLSPPVLSEYGYSDRPDRSEEHTSELQSLMRISYAVFCLKKKKIKSK